MKQVVEPRQRPHSADLWGECFRLMTDFWGTLMCVTLLLQQPEYITLYVMHTLKMNVQQGVIKKVMTDSY